MVTVFLIIESVLAALTAPTVLRKRVSASPQASHLAHTWVGQQLDALSLSSPMRDAYRLAVSELVSNSIRHSVEQPTYFELSITLRADDVELTIRHDGFGLADLSMMKALCRTDCIGDAQSPGGRGLFLVFTLFPDLEFSSNGEGERVVLKRPCALSAVKACD